MTRLVVAAVLSLLSVASWGGPVVYLPLDETWQLETEGAWRARLDHRNLLAMRHPWVPSSTGAYALATREVKIPEDWQAPIYLTFYCSDDYHTDHWRPDGSWLTAEGFLGHRFKRILVDGQPVGWNQDVSDPCRKGESPRYRELLPVRGGQTVTLGLLVYDAVPSTKVLPEDFYQPGDRDVTRETDPDAARFMTSVYWGDLALVQGTRDILPQRRPVEELVRTVHDRRWPTPPLADGWPEATVQLGRAILHELPAPGFPLRQGIPFPPGKINSAADVRFTAGSKALSVQKRVLARWPDNSVRWMLADFPNRNTEDTVTLSFRRDPGEMGSLPTLSEADGGIAVRHGTFAYGLTPGDPVTMVRHGGVPLLSKVSVGLRADNATCPGSAVRVWALEEGAFRTTVVAEGQYDAPDQAVGSFSLRVTSFAGLPYLLLQHRIVNDTGRDLPVSALTVRLDLPEAPAEWKAAGSTLPGRVSLVQRDGQLRLLNGMVLPEAGPIWLAWKGSALAVPRFAERFPKSISTDGAEVTIDLAAAGDSPILLTAGEALSHDIWLAAGDVDPVAFARTAEHPPILQNADYYCAAGVLWRARPYADVPKLAERMAEYRGKSWTGLGQSAGLRDFPDSPYLGKPNTWSNNYYERMLGLWSAWFMSGEREWYDRAVDVSRHLLDTAVVHAPVPGHDWLGALHGPGENHVPGPWNPTLRAGGLDLLHKLTGEPAALAGYLGVAEYCLRSGAGRDGSSVRQHAGPFSTITWAFLDTRDAGFMDEGARRTLEILNQLDRRRGVWPDTHGSQVYRGNVPWMIAQIARPLYLWYHATGDIDAAQTLVGLAESIICENTPWDEPGAVLGYSHNPRYAPTATYDLAILPLIFAAYELSEDTFFLDAARAQWERWLASDAMDSVLNVYWNTPWLVWYLDEYGILADGGKPEQE